jgi:hypothetical protein
MNANIVSAVFDDRMEAERAVTELRSAGVRQEAISFVARDDHGKARETDADGHGEGVGEKVASVASKAALGSGVGAALGVAALAIPGVGPLVAAGAIAEAAIGGAALTGTALGAAAGGLTGLLSKHGVGEDDARYYEDRINQGGVFVSVNADQAGVSPDTASDILYSAGGHSSARSKMI